jgi:hypothetical protein
MRGGLVLLVVAVLLAICCHQVSWHTWAECTVGIKAAETLTASRAQCNSPGQAAGGRRGGGGRSRSSSGRSSWGSGTSGGGKARGGRKMSTLKKAAVVGAGVYVGYQIGKATSR